MRFNARRLQTLCKKEKVIVKSEEGVVSEEYSTTPFLFEGIVYESHRNYSYEQYGHLLKGTKSILVDLEELHFSIGDGLCINVDFDAKPNYRVKEVLHYTTHLKLIVESL